ncbi:DUF4397 domain-containing protein [Nocardioides sp. J2M5]|uniref:DUF4397 domain-containing protein n=1 Tax=Nocardioides palaemonis TaxID=2829810 RepID=UPI001BA4B2A7|nr:DUF4397 domain-containing protein [Nocardioides palaemonis]MBS2937565.1 DUF4397 domain-containing protein [Nocardioides palaemonis]
MRRLVPAALAATLVLLPLAAPATAAPTPALVTVVQAVPGAGVAIAVDGRPITRNAAVGDIVGPLGLTPGRHDISFTGADFTVDSTLEVGAGEASDVVLHLPAEVDGDPVVHSYDAPTGAIGPGKARVLLAHTATVPPADVQVDGQTVFTNIANGEFADADVPEGSIEVALLPSGSGGDPILGPLDLSVAAGTLSMVYAYGNPSDGSMAVIAHTEELSPDGSVVPTRIDTGSAGLVRDAVTTFAAPAAHGGRGPLLPVALLLVVAAAAAAGRARWSRSRVG